MQKKTVTPDNEETSYIISDAIHDIKNPLASMSVLIQLLKRAVASGDTEKIQDYATRIDFQTGTVISFINLFSDFVKVYYNTISLSFEVISFREFFTAFEKKYPFIHATDVSFDIAADTRRLLQAFEHLFKVLSDSEEKISYSLFLENKLGGVVFENITDSIISELDARKWENLKNDGFLFPIAVGIIEAHKGSVTVDVIKHVVRIQLPVI